MLKFLLNDAPCDLEITSVEVREVSGTASGTVEDSFFDAKAMKAALCEMSENYLPKMIIPSLRDLPRSIMRMAVPESVSICRSRAFPRMAVGVR